MGKMTDIFQIVTPSTPTSVVQDNQLMDTGYAATSNYTWYQRLIQGSGTRLTRYNEYDVMDNDVEVARALDIIAEEMTGRNTKTSLPIELKILDEKHANTEDTIVLTLRTACHHWCKIHGFDANRLFKLSRNMVKYGDCFFRKSSNFKKWEWIPSGAIVGAIVDDRDVTNVLGYRIRTDTKSTGVANSTSSPFRNAADHGKFENVSIDNMVVFSINDDMSDAAPFGESVLRTVYKTHKQKELLEDAIIIYRIQRAPERRVFYIDVGKMPPHRVKSYLETIKNEIRQKKIPSNNMNGQSSVDSIYNPQSMLEDIFLAQRSDGVGSKVEVLQGGCFSMDTKVSLLDGRELSISDIELELAAGKELWTYSCEKSTGKVVPGIISWAGVTRKAANVMRLTFNNGESVVCTPDHRFCVYGQEYKRAHEFTIGDSVIPLYRRKECLNDDYRRDYEQFFDNSTKTWVHTHRMVADTLKDTAVKYWVYKPEKSNGKYEVRHHIDFNRFNNSPSNLCFMSYIDHRHYHAKVTATFFRDLKHSNIDEYNRIKEARHNSIRRYWDNITTEQIEARSAKARKTKSEWSQERKSNHRLTVSNSLRKYINGLSPEQRAARDDASRKHFGKHANSIFNEKMLNDLEFRAQVLANRRKAWTDGKRQLKAEQMSAQQKQRHSDPEYQRWYRKQHQENQKVVFTHDMLKFAINLIKGKTSHQFTLVDVIRELNANEELISELRDLNKHKNVPNWNIDDGFTSSNVRTMVKQFGYDSWYDLRKNESIHNHTIVKIEYLDDTVDVGTLTIDQDEVHHSHHTFALSCGVFVLNSQLGENSDLDYFSDKVLCGLRIPKGWMGRHREDSGAVFNDGKLGAAYIEEQQFAKFVERLQVYVSAVLDYEFKLFLFESNIQIDNTIFEIALPKPSNYEKYKQADLDSALLGTIGTADSISWLSKRWIARNYLQMSEEQLIDNENLLKQEKGIDSKDKTLQSIYGPQAEGDMGGGFGGGMGGLGGDLGGFGGELGGGAEAAPFGSEGGEGEIEGSVPAEQTAPLGGTAPGSTSNVASPR
jgi:hypothetical protein